MRTKFFFLLLFIGCAPDLSDDSIPFRSFPDIVINVSLPAYNKLNTTGSQYIDGGIRGIILRKASPNVYYAFERNCSYHPNEACSTVEIHISGLFMTDPCCSSSFDFEGNPTGGVAWRPLGKYQTSLDGSMLTITDRVLQ
jgi:hypothetical protein